MFDDLFVAESFILDEEKVKWMLHRKNRLHFSHPLAMRDSIDIWKELKSDMHQTFTFLEGCDDEELSLLSEDIADVITEFNENGEGEFVDFILELAYNRGVAEFKEEIESAITDIQEAYAMDQEVH
ncbi:MAG: hypothetical protein WD907_03790 [Bacilli bacterium]